MDDSRRMSLSANHDLVREHSNGTFCRLCFSQIYELHRIFPPNDQPNQLLVKKIGYCTDISITFVKDSNACICTKCIGLVEEFFRFKQLCSANEQWLKSDYHGHVATSAHPDQELVIQDGELLTKSQSCSSLLTIETEQINTSEDFDEATENGINSFMDYPIKNKHLSKQSYNASEVTSNSRSLRARKPTTRIPSKNQTNQLTTLSVKSETGLNVEIQENNAYSTESSNDSANDQCSSGSDVFQLVRGSKSRSNLQYLVYHGYRYSNKNNDGKIWRCTHHAPICCKAVVMLEKNRVIELNNHFHNHSPPQTRKKKVHSNNEDDSKHDKSVKISLVLKKDKDILQRVNKVCNLSKQSQSNNWFIKANRKTVDGFTYTFCGLRKDGVIRLKCVTKNCAGRIYVNSNGDLLRTNKVHCHPPHTGRQRD
ncbi:uncharacterized protein LOC131440454 [Malaya genurostris]|uniref:uncharacterized protein LOC131440454 n=1 Tax=Malaya genurostris TaxID=325434 RepID=UPI0026F37E48|nr:uncharacterized protein LOC131440454 [Malaya genurostris]